MIRAVIRVSEMGQYAIDLEYQLDTDGKLIARSRLVLKITGSPFLEDDILVQTEVTHRVYTDVDECQFLDLIGEENIQGNLILVEFVGETDGE